MEYTIMAVAAFALFAYLAFYSRLPKKPLAAGLGLAVLFQLVFDNLMTAAGLWIFNPAATLGIFLPYIPLENLLFGASLFLASAWSWENSK